jgi:membrane protein DedA with SNARE-associated domain
MVLESACIPIPSEAIMLFGGAMAGGLVLAGVHPHLNLVVVALAGAGGNLIGSLIAYTAGRLGGRPLFERWGRYLLLRPHDLVRAEAFFARRGDLAVLVGRVVPVVRTFISLPAGIAEMPLARFATYTLAGCLPWTFGLALAGDTLAGQWKTVSSDFTPISIAIAGAALVGVGWWGLHRLRQPREPSASRPA